MDTEIHCGASVTLSGAMGIRDKCVTALEAEGSIVVDVGDIVDADLSFIQLVLALRAAAAEAGREVRLRSPAPAPVAALLERAGFLAAPSAQDLDFWFHGERAQ